MPATAEVPGRAVAFGPLAAGKSAVCQFFAESDDEESLWTVAGKAGGHAVIRRPFRVDSLPAKVSITEMAELLMPDKGEVAAQPGTHGPKVHPDPPGPRTFVIGLGGDELAPVFVRIPAGGVLAALGGQGGGKTNFLRLLPALNAGTAEWLAPDAGRDACEYWSDALQRAAAGTVGQHAIALVDDADLLPQSAHQDLAELNNRGIGVVFTAGFSPLLVQRVPLALSARGSGTGLLIAPRSLMDGDLFGIRFDAEPNPPPGRSVLVTNGRPMPVQLGWVPDTSQTPAHKQDAAGLQTAGGEPPVREA
jgi:S-DNA-T family DNA segregation ATPase FtsK/SpoIIIE